MNFARDVVDGAPSRRRAMVCVGRDGERREWTMAEVADAPARAAGGPPPPGRRGGPRAGVGDAAGRAAGALAARGVRRGDVVMTLVGNRPEWVIAMVAGFRIGAVALPSTEQLRPKDLRARFDLFEPRLVVADRRNLDTVADSGFSGPVAAVPDESLF